jgi:hypothetical protein
MVQWVGCRGERADGDATERTDGVLGTKIAGDVDGDLVPLVGGIDEGVERMVHTGDVRASEVGDRSRLRHVSKVGGRWNGCADCSLIGRGNVVSRGEV